MTHHTCPSPLTAVPGDPPSLYLPPFSVQGSSVLSEDYFLTDNVIMNAGDTVRPFVRGDGTGEALLLSGGVVSHLSRSGTATSGWTCTPLPAPPEVPQAKPVDIVTATAPDGTVWALILRIFQDTQIELIIGSLFSLGSSGTWEWAEDSALYHGGLGRLQAGLDSGGNVYFYVFYLTSPPGQQANGSFALWQPHINSQPIVITSLAGVDMVDARVNWDSSGQGSVTCLTSKNVMEWHAGAGSYSPDTFDPAGTGQTPGVAALLWTGWVNYQNPDYPGIAVGYAYQMQSGDIYFSTPESETLGDADIGSAGSGLGQDKVAVWQDGTGLFGFAFLVADTAGGTVTVISEYGNPGDVPLEVTDPIPLQPGVSAVFGQTADATQGTLFVVLADATLNVLAKDPVAGWSLVPVLQASAVLQELDAWRVQLSVTDANGVPAAGVQLSVSADRQAGAWQASGHTLLAPGSTATFTTDASGRVTFATPAVELDAPQLSVSVASAADLGAAASVQVSPDAEVQAFLAGTAPLNDIGTLTPEALLSAASADGTKLFPVLASMPADQQTQAASGVAQAISQCIQAGQGATPGPDDVKSWILDMKSGVPVYTSSTESGGTQAPALTAVGSLSGWWDSVENDADSFFHGLRHDASQVVTCTANWIKAETGEGWNWVVNLAVTLAGDVSAEVSYVINDIKSAIHAVTAFFNKLGADIAGAISWLRQNIIDLIKEASANAAVVEGWLNQAPGVVNGCLEHYKGLANNFFTGLQDRIDTAIDGLMPELAKVTFSNPVAASVSGPQPGGIPGGVSAPQAAAFDLAEFVNSARASWLLDKILSYFSGDTQVAPIQPLQNAMDELAVAVRDGLAFAEDIGTVLWTGLQAMSSSRGSYDQATFAQFFQALKDAVADLLGFADAVVNAVLDLVEAVMDQLGALLAHQFDEIPVIGGLLNKLGVDDTMSVAHLVSMVLMYPATLANRIKNGSSSSLFPTSAATATKRLAAAELDWALGLQMSASVGQGTWGIIDMIGDAAAAAKQAPPAFVGWTDIVAPCILNILQWPGTPTGAPFQNAIDGSVYDGSLIEPTWLVGWVPPAVGLCGKAADYEPAAPSDTPPAPGPQPTFPEIGMYFTAASAVAGTITGSIYNFQAGQSKGTQAAGILANVSNIVAPFLTSEAIEISEGISVPAKLILDAAANMGAAVAMSLS